ncbi:MAG: aldo/keto reductase [Chloroflexi bacterium]|nr:aldo/keto reductase [Chloroflexota bacterium]
MEYRSLGRTGLVVSPICFGTMNLGGVTPKDESIRMIDEALDAGINFLDTANVYSQGESERVVGEALARNGKRRQVVLATKYYNAMSSGPNERGVSRGHIMQAVEDSLRRLQTDYIDLYQQHRPSFTVPQDETLRALDDLVHQGKVRYIGTSTFPAWKIMEGLAIGERLGLTRYVSEQPPYNLLDRRIENELVPLALAHGLGIIPWSPIAGGVLAGRYRVGEPPPAGSRAARQGRGQMAPRYADAGREIGQRMVGLARERAMSAGQLALLWVKDQPGITAPISGPRTPEHLREAIAVADMSLSEADRAVFDALVPPGTAVANFFNTSGWMKQAVG